MSSHDGTNEPVIDTPRFDTECENELKKVKREIDESKRKLDESKRKLHESELSRQEVERKLHESESLRTGAFYTTFDKLWATAGKSFSVGDFDKLVREKSPSFTESCARESKPHNSFLQTMKYANGIECLVKDDAESARTSHSKREEKTEIWANHVLTIPTVEATRPAGSVLHGSSCHGVDVPPVPGKKDVDESCFEAPDSTSPKNEEPKDEIQQLNEEHFVLGQIAHLAPASPLHSSLYFDVATWVFGSAYASRDVPASVIQKLIHGATKEKPSRDSKNCRSTGKSTGKRLPHTGLKHMACNKIRLCGQADFYDENPFILIVPIMSIEEMRTWNGEGYSAIFIEACKGISMQEVASLTAFTSRIALADSEEIEKARNLLESILKGLAYSLMKVDESNAPFLNKNHWKILHEFQKKLQNYDSVIVPTLLTEADGNKVAKITFWAQGTTGGHPAPDPILLGTKAAINWSKFFGQQLLASGEPEEDYDSDDQSVIAEREYLEWAKRIQQKQQENDILGRVVGVETPSSK